MYIIEPEKTDDTTSLITDEAVKITTSAVYTKQLTPATDRYSLNTIGIIRHDTTRYTRPTTANRGDTVLRRSLIQIQR